MCIYEDCNNTINDINKYFWSHELEDFAEIIEELKKSGRLKADDNLRFNCLVFVSELLFKGKIMKG